MAILLLPTVPLLKTTRVRIVLDSAMILLAAITFSWYFFLGPALLQGNEPLLVRMVSAAYPCPDLVQILCLLLLLLRVRSKPLRPAVLLLCCSLLLITVCDALFDYQMAQGSAPAMTLLEGGWLGAYLLVGLTAQALRRTGQEHQSTPQIMPGPTSAQTASVLWIWLALLPYTLVPAVLLLTFFLWQNAGVDGTLRSGVSLGAILLVGVVFVRQLLSVQETHLFSKHLSQLHDALQLAHHELRVNHQALTQANSRLQALTTTDPLTELPNHRALMDQLGKEIGRARRYERPVSLLFFDADRFKKVNDTYGHAAGDAVLRHISQLASSVLRSEDTLARFGGEEFVIVLPEADANEAERVAERLRAVIAASPVVLAEEQGELSVTVSIGVWEVGLCA